MQVLLQPSKDVLTQRVQQRAAEGTHFMPASLLESQLALMEVDSSAYRYGET
jgi:gluconokinase